MPGGLPAGWSASCPPYIGLHKKESFIHPFVHLLKINAFIHFLCQPFINLSLLLSSVVPLSPQVPYIGLHKKNICPSLVEKDTLDEKPALQNFEVGD